MGPDEAQDPSVGTIVDGINFAYNALTSSFDFVDVDTVEVTRGPQGTLLGKNTSLGVVNITRAGLRSRRPPTTASSLRDNEGLFATAAIGGPVVDGLLGLARPPSRSARARGTSTTSTTRTSPTPTPTALRPYFSVLLNAQHRFQRRGVAIDVQPRAGETTKRPHGEHAHAHHLFQNGSANTALDTRQAPGAPLVLAEARATASTTTTAP
jgi:outer membrane receptor protein involved in Fe transport